MILNIPFFDDIKNFLNFTQPKLQIQLVFGWYKVWLNTPAKVSLLWVHSMHHINLKCSWSWTNFTINKQWLRAKIALIKIECKNWELLNRIERQGNDNEHEIKNWIKSNKKSLLTVSFSSCGYFQKCMANPSIRHHNRSHFCFVSAKLRKPFALESVK